MYKLKENPYEKDSSLYTKKYEIIILFCLKIPPISLFIMLILFETVFSYIECLNSVRNLILNILIISILVWMIYCTVWLVLGYIRKRRAIKDYEKSKYERID